MELQEELSERNDKNLSSEIYSTKCSFDDLTSKRNKIMLKTIDAMRTLFPDKRLFIIAGRDHFRGSVVQENLEGQPYIALEPTHEPNEKDNL